MAFEKLTPEELGAQLRDSGKTGIALDIDDTLSLTGLQWFGWLSERCGNPEDLEISELMKKYHDVRQVPYWPPEVVEPHIEEFFLSHVFHDELILIHGADDAVRQIHEVVPIVAYITARPDDVYESTRTWLARHGFPDAPLVFRPRGGGFAARSIWKARVLTDLYPHVQGVVDDHPHLASQLKELGYAGKLYLYDHGNNANVYDDEHEVLLSWEDILARLQSEHATPV